MPDAKLPRSVKAQELQLGDTITPEYLDGHRNPFDACVVEGIETLPQTGTKLLKLFRPYVAANNFSYGAPNAVYLICYTGVEHFTIFDTSGGTWTLWSRQELK
jgi:hypothetical protein